MWSRSRWHLCGELIAAVLLCNFIASQAFVKRSEIVLTDNGYDGVLVAIGENVPEDRRIIERIKSLFDDATFKLYSATKRRASFRNITILVPQSWQVQKDYQQASTETFDKANIIVDLPNEEHVNNPYVMQFDRCGKDGEFMHLTPEFLLDNETSEAMFGDLGKVIVHEWGHLRWGLFDEYPRNSEESFYQSAITGSVEATRCSLSITGILRNKKGGTCKINGTTSLPEPGCRFIPSDGSSGSQTSSYMYYNHLRSVVGFCDNDEKHPEHFHNAEAPSLQNKLCGGNSSWQVMREHKDFKNGNNPPRDSMSPPTKVNYKVVQRSGFVAVMVMDISGSMSNDNYYIKLNTAVRNHILNTVRQGSLIGLVEFDNRAVALTPSLRTINTQQDRINLANIVPMKANGGTSIGSGLVEAMKLLNAGGRNTKGTFIVVVTDGEENAAPTVATVKDQIIAQGIIVDTVLFSQNADRSLISLAQQTGGISYYYSGDEASMGLLNAFKSMVATREGNSVSTPISIVSQVLPVAGGAENCVQPVIDKSLRREAKIIMSWSSNYAFRATVSSPSGNFTSVVTSSSNVFAATVVIPDLAEVGRWKVCVRSSQTSTISVGLQVEGKATSASATGRDAPITLSARASDAEAHFSGKSVKPLAIYATVSRGYSPVVNATVRALIEGPRKGVAKETLVLLDDGSGADITKDDGIYSSYYMSPTVTGDHTIEVQVEGDDGSKVKMVVGGSRAPMIDGAGEAPDEARVMLEETGLFERVASGGFFTIRSLPAPKQDIFPPSAILDLKVTAASYEDQLVTIQFTAVGDDFDKGRASSYELRYGSSFTDIFYNFENATRIHQKDVVSGNVDAPAESHETETISFSVIPGELIVIGIKAIDKAGNKGPLSNIVSAKPSYVSKTDLPSDDASTWLITCGPDTLSVVIPRNSSNETYYFYGTKCRFAYNGSVHSANVTLKQCGLKEIRERDGVTYSGSVARAPSDAVIVDDELELITVQCTYRQRDVNSSQASFDAQAKASASGVSIRGSSDTNVTAVTLRQFPDDSFQNAYADDAYPLKVKLGSTLFFQLKAVGEVNGVELAVVGCRAFGSHNKEHVLIRDGCVVSRALRPLLSPSSYEKRFELKSFTLVGSEGPIYLECSTKTCDKAYGQCGGCSPASPYRSRRHADFDASRLMKVNAGPIEVVAPH